MSRGATNGSRGGTRDWSSASAGELKDAHDKVLERGKKLDDLNKRAANMSADAYGLDAASQKLLAKQEAKSKKNKKSPARDEKSPLLEEAKERPKRMTLPPPSSSPYTETGERKKGRIILPPGARTRSPINEIAGYQSIAPPQVQAENTETKCCSCCTIL